MVLVKQIARMATDPRDDRPFHPVKINHITIERGGAGAAPAKALREPVRKRHTSTTRKPATPRLRLQIQIDVIAQVNRACGGNRN